MSSGQPVTGGPLHLAVDLGAGSGRAVLGGLSEDGLLLEEIHRFQYEPETDDGHLRWPFGQILAGIIPVVLRPACSAGRRWQQPGSDDNSPTQRGTWVTCASGSWRGET